MASPSSSSSSSSSSTSSLVSSSVTASTSSRDRSAVSKSGEEEEQHPHDGSDVQQHDDEPNHERQAQTMGRSLLTSPFRWIGSWLPGWMREPTPAPSPQLSQSFQDYFERKYCSPDLGAARKEHPTFLNRAFSQAAQLAQTRHKLLLVYIHSDSHQDTDNFCRGVLLSDGLKAIVDENFVFWGCDVSMKDGLETGVLLEATTYPFMAVLACIRDKISPVSQIEGFRDVDQLIEHLLGVLGQYGPLLEAAKAEHEEQLLRRMQLEEQDRAYEEALRRDRERELEQQRILEEQQAKEQQSRQEEAEALAKLERRKELKARLLSELGPEPDLPTAALIRFKFSSGQQLLRRFRESDSVDSLYKFVFCQEDGLLPHTDCSEPPEQYGFTLATPYPKKVLTTTQTLKEAGLCPQAIVLVH